MSRNHFLPPMSTASLLGNTQGSTQCRGRPVCFDLKAGTRMSREGSGNSDSMVSDSLASPTPPGGGEPKEQGDEENETESRGHV